MGSHRLAALPSRVRLIACAAAAGSLWFSASVARADGDPASDVLAIQPVFVPNDAGVPVGAAVELSQLVQAAQKAHVPVRVALIGSSYDLGAITSLWRMPQTYARFLGTELSPIYKGRLLIVMPNGFGIYHGNHGVAAERHAIAGVPIGRGGPALASAAIAAVARIAATTGHPLATPQVAAAAHSRTSGSHNIAWLALGIGTLVIASVWLVSLRIRPLRVGRRRRAEP